MSQMTCSHEAQSSEEEELPACSSNAPCQDYAPDLTVTLMSPVRLSLSNYCKVHHVVGFPFTTMISHRSENDFPQPLPPLPLSFAHLKMRRLNWKHTDLDSALSKLCDLGTLPNLPESGDVHTAG